MKSCLRGEQGALKYHEKAAGCLSDANYYSNTNALVCSTVKGFNTGREAEAEENCDVSHKTDKMRNVMIQCCDSKYWKQ